jgi:hypothetical protein
MTYGTANIDAIATSSGQILGAGDSTAFKNRIINGAMVIDQRNAGASVTVTSGYTGYAVDRFRIDPPVGQSITGQQVTASLSGFQNALTYTAGTGSTNASDQSEIVYFIEGYNVADLQFGTANAQTITLSFWAKSSLSGTFGLVLENNDRNRAYVTSYSLPTTNTWTYITKTIVGDTSGTWLYTNGRGIGIRWDMGAGTTYSGAVTNAWGASPFIGITAGAGVVKLTQNTGATFTITGVQLEVGSQATSFDFRDYGRELILCQRYYFQWGPNPTIVYGPTMHNITTSGSWGVFFLPVSMRASPTMTTQGTASSYGCYQGGTQIFCNSVPVMDTSNQQSPFVNFPYASVLTLGGVTSSRATYGVGFLGFNAEL